MRSMTEEVVPLTEGSESQLSFGEATSSAPSGHLPLNRAFQALGKAFGGRSGDRPYGMGGRCNAAPAARASDARRYGTAGDREIAPTAWAGGATPPLRGQRTMLAVAVAPANRLFPVPWLPNLPC